MIANMSALPRERRRVDRKPDVDAGRRATRATIGMPKPMRISEYGDTLTVVRVLSASARISSRRAPDRVNHLHVRTEKATRPRAAAIPPRARLKVVGVHGDRQAELLRDLVVAHRRGRGGAAPGETERQQAAVRMVAPSASRSRVRSREIDARVVARARRRAVREPRANTDFGKRAQRGFRVLGRADVVAPVVHERDARVHGLGRREPPGRVHVIGRVERADGARRRKVAVLLPVAGEAAQQRGPHVPVRFDEARQHEHAGAVDDFGAWAPPGRGRRPRSRRPARARRRPRCRRRRRPSSARTRCGSGARCARSCVSAGCCAKPSRSGARSRRRRRATPPNTSRRFHRVAFTSA